MKAQAMSFTFLGNEGQVTIPFFQRRYVWEKTNWEDMLEDLFNENKTHFLGSLILKQQERQSGKPKEVVVIDGQQRLTTLSVLIKALYDSFSESTKANCKTSILTYLFYKRNQTDSMQFLKIQHSRLDSKYYKRVIETGISQNELLEINETSNRILQCYKFFVEELAKKSCAEREALFNRILDTENKILVLIDLTEKEDEQAIFDTINSAGVRLSGADIIKNAIFQRALDLMKDQEDVGALFNEHWEEVFSKDDEAVSFWSRQRATGRLMRDNIEILFHSISVIKGFFDPDKHTLSDLSSLYKRYLCSLETDALRTFIKEISDFATLFRERILAWEGSTLFSYSDTSLRVLHILDACEISTFHPLVLAWLQQFKDDEDVIRTNFSRLERFVMRRMIAKKETKSYNKLCKDFLAQPAMLDEKLREVSDEEVLKGLQGISNKAAALILFWVELRRRHNDPQQSLKELKYNYTLEHILPQKWEQYWVNVPVKDDSGKVIESPDVAKRERTSKCYWIGNMTLLNSSLNTALRNFPYEKKINGDGRKRGIRYYGDLLITRNDLLQKFDTGDRIWDEAKIVGRTNALFTEVRGLWPA